MAALWLWGASYTEVGGGVGTGRYTTGACVHHEIRYREVGGYGTYRRGRLRADARISYATQGRRLDLAPDGTGRPAETESIPPRNLVAANATFGGEWKWGAFAAGLIGSNGTEFFNGTSPIFGSARGRVGPDFLHLRVSILEGELAVTDAAFLHYGIESLSYLPIDIYLGIRMGPGRNSGPALAVGKLLEDSLYLRVSASAGPSKTREDADALGFTAGVALGYRVLHHPDDEDDE